MRICHIISDGIVVNKIYKYIPLQNRDKKKLSYRIDFFVVNFFPEFILFVYYFVCSLVHFPFAHLHLHRLSSLL